MIPNYAEKIKQYIVENRRDLYIATVIFFVGLSGFGLGRLSVLWPEKESITIGNQDARIMNQALTDITAGAQHKATPLDSKLMIPDSNKKYVASKSGTAYHLPWCPGAQKIKEENKIWFQTKEEAESRGYKPAGNCEGL